MDKKQRIGHYSPGSMAMDKYRAYIPKPLPPVPELDLGEIYTLLDQANSALGRLDGMSMVLPDPTLFLYMYVRKEAVMSSQIEGTQSSLSDLLMFENSEIPGVPIDDVTEVSSYVAAMDYSLERIKSLPLSLRLIKEIHEKLMSNSRGGSKQPGEFRKTQNWIGGEKPSKAKFVPPPPEHLMECLDSLEKFLHDENVKLPVLVKAALVHVQFETIHPFLDGNGRLGRLLITLILCSEGLLNQPLLYLSLYFKKHREDYYNFLQSLRETGDWEEWIKFFLNGVIETANQATDTAKSIMFLFEADKKMLEQKAKGASAILVIHNYLQRHPLTTTTKIKDECNLVLPTILRSLKTLEDLGIVKEITGKQRHKVFVYSEYLKLLNDGV
jgi:Fic family protein